MGKKQILQNKVINKIRRLSIKELDKMLSSLNEKPVDTSNLESVPATIKIEGKKYHTIIFRHKSNPQSLPAFRFLS